MELLLNENELLNLGEDLSGIRIVCGDGHCWVTQAGDSRDHFVRAGESFTVESRGQLVLVAMERSRLMLFQTENNNRHFICKLINHLSRKMIFANP